MFFHRAAKNSYSTKPVQTKQNKAPEIYCQIWMFTPFFTGNLFTRQDMQKEKILHYAINIAHHIELIKTASQIHEVDICVWKFCTMHT